MAPDPRPPPGPEAEEPFRQLSRARRMTELAVILPLAGTFLVMPPFVRVFSGSTTLAGLPLVLVYLFGVWAALVALTFLLARRLMRRREEEG